MILKQGPYPTLVSVVTTLFGEVINAAPITWFSPISYEPPLMMVALKLKCDTLKNILHSKEFVLQTIPFWAAQSVHNMAKSISREKSEVVLSGFEIVSSKHIKVPRLKIALQWFECRYCDNVEYGITHVQIVGRLLNNEDDFKNVDQSLLYNGDLSYTLPKNSFKANPY